ncbi:NAD(P)H-binding protein [Streptomyces sp. NPDC086777]|uniref:NmrA family NAD(P)-binding protein n=1 Tax=Streptomyces sp. NPDC086777 TaxID=3154866 RepID=UPI0034500BC8
MPEKLILVTGAGNAGSVGRKVVERLRRRGLPTRALVRKDDERADTLRATGAEVVVGDLTQTADVFRALEGCHRIYLGMSVSSSYLEATTAVAAAAREHGALEVLVNMSQMTVSQMTITSTSESHQQRLHLLSERILSWSGLPVVQVRPTIFMENPLFQFAIQSTPQRITVHLPFGSGRTSPVATSDVADVVVTVLAEPRSHLGRVYELTGPVSRDMNGVAEQFAKAAGRPATYVDVPPEEWAQSLAAVKLPDHLIEHVTTMARLHRENRYDRISTDIETILGRPALDVRDFAENNPQLFQ